MGDAAADWFAEFTDWFCLCLEPSREFIALLGLNQRNVHAYLPAMVSQRRIRGRLVEVRRPLLGPYLFAQCHSEDLAGLMTSPGVWGILPHGRAPEPVPASTVEDLRARELAGEFHFRDTQTDKRRHRRLLRSFKEACLTPFLAMTCAEEGGTFVLCVVDLRDFDGDVHQVDWDAADVSDRCKVVSRENLPINKALSLVRSPEGGDVPIRNVSALRYAVPAELWESGLDIDEWVEEAFPR